MPKSKPLPHIIEALQKRLAELVVEADTAKLAQDGDLLDRIRLDIGMNFICAYHLAAENKLCELSVPILVAAPAVKEESVIEDAACALGDEIAAQARAA